MSAKTKDADKYKNIEWRYGNSHGVLRQLPLDNSADDLITISDRERLRTYGTPTHGMVSRTDDGQGFALRCQVTRRRKEPSKGIKEEVPGRESKGFSVWNEESPYVRLERRTNAQKSPRQ
jgi:hypothetical protein